MGLIYPSMRYRLDEPHENGRIVFSADEDRALGPEWEDPYGLRVQHVCTSTERVQETEKNIHVRKPGRPRKGER